MKNKIVLVVLIINIILSYGCERGKSLYDINDISINGLYEVRENQLYLVFSIPQESFYYCSSVNSVKPRSLNSMFLSFTRSKINQAQSEEIDYRTEYVRNNLDLLKEFDLDPNYNYIKLDEDLEELYVLDSKSEKRILIKKIILSQ